MTSTGSHMTRRQLFGLGIGAISAAFSTACLPNPTPGERLMFTDSDEKLSRKAAEQGRLLARPKQAKEQALLGLQPLGLGGNRDALLYVPPNYKPDRPAPLAVMLHGAGGSAQPALDFLKSSADKAGIILLAPESRRQTWDVLLGGFGPDVVFINRALEHVFDRYVIDAARIAVGGFSDGASYALSLGITNGDFLTHIIAFSPGFLAPAGQAGAPRIFISHGKKDQILPIERCSRRIVPQLQKANYDVRYKEFDGPHTVPHEIAREAVEWFIS